MPADIRTLHDTTTTNVLVALSFFHGPEASLSLENALWIGMSLCQTHYAEAHAALSFHFIFISFNSARQAGAAANPTANNKATKYDQLTRTHVFYPVAIETYGE